MHVFVGCASFRVVHYGSITLTLTLCDVMYVGEFAITNQYVAFNTCIVSKNNMHAAVEWAAFDPWQAFIWHQTEKSRTVMESI